MIDDTEPSPPGTPASENRSADKAVNGAPATPRLQVDSSDLKSSYANFCNANFTREEIVLNFGTNHDWDRSSSGVDVKLSHRVILSPFAARRVADMLAQLMRDYEQRHGKLV